ncbi:MAG TPA: hypothetical protein VMX38_13420 [Verrucomicrobiae bacterium]|jgi:opacity protein-like surface antigen|nr:hypothetical protein [Verrucomicrobiae bacterium]
MIRKFAAFPVRYAEVVAIWLIVLAASAACFAQQNPQAPAQDDPSSQQTQTQQPANAQQPADTQQSSSQETAPEETIPGRKPKPKLYDKWVFNAGGGASLVNGTTKTFVRGGGGVAAAGAARNFSPFFGLRADFQFDNLPLRQSALALAGAPGATSHAYSLTFGPIINIPVTNEWSGYIVFGADYLHRSGKLDSSSAIPGTGCNPFFIWWGPCYADSLPVNGNFLHESQNEYGYFMGAGVARKVSDKIEVYGEFRWIHGAANRLTTDIRPITVGARWRF